MLNQAFKPQLSPQQVKDYKRLYDQNPDQFNEEIVQSLEQHAEHYRLPFAKSNNGFLSEVGNVIGQAAKGFGEGFTTLDMGGDPPEGDAQEIARNLGHLAGFVGYVPHQIFGNKLIKAYKLAEAAKALKGKSVPMLIANAATKKASKLSNAILGRALTKRAAATGVATKFIQSNTTQDIVSGAFHLGIASAVGSWRGGVDEMMAGFVGGAKTGAVFRGIGNMVKTGSDGADKGLRALASSLFTGLPSTMRGDTTPMQIYEYVLGAYFGANEMPVHKRMAGKHLAKMARSKDPEAQRDPELVTGWDKIDPPGQKLVLKELARLNDPVTALASDIIKSDPNIKPEQAEILAKEILKAQEKERQSVKFSEQGEPEKEFTDQELKEINLSREDSDPQTIPNSISVNAKSFVEFNMSKYNDSLSKGEKLDVAIDLNNQWAKFIPKGRKNGKNPYQDMVEYINKKHPDFLMEETDINYWRRIGFTRIRQKPVDIVTMHNGVARVMSSDKNGVTINEAGNRRQISEEPKSIEKVWMEDSGMKLGAEPRSVLAVLDSVTRNTSIGVREFSLSKYKNHLINRAAAKNEMNDSNFPNKADIINGEKAYNKEMGRTFNLMNTDGKYYFGGKGDAERMYFTSYHPGTPRTKASINKLFTTVKSELKKAGATKIEIDKINRDRKSFIEEYAKGIGSEERAGKIFDKAYLSNVLYDIRLNGFKNLNDLSKVLKGGFINDAKAFNKRAQIWFTSGYSADVESLTMAVEKSRQGFKQKSDIKNDSLNIKIIEDYGKDMPHKIGTANSEYVQVTDGAILGRSDVVDGLNKGAGLPTEGGANKSFIVSPNPQHGALLGKYMIHSASPKLENYMQKNNIHFIIPRSAAKQIGTRKVGSMNWNRKQPTVDAETYQLPIKDIKIVPSEIVDSHSLMAQGLPKQMLTNFTPYGHFDPSRAPFKTEAEYNKALNETFDDMYSSLSGKRVEGVPEFNSLINNLIKNPKVNSKDIPHLINNLDSIGVRELLTAMKAKGNEEFANAAYAKIQRMNKDILEEMRADGEHSELEIQEMKNEMIDFVTVQERIQKLVPNSLAGFLHKFSRDYRMSVMRNYIVNGITRPKIKNSGSTRMRPYEIGMSKEGRTAELEKRDDIFFLDEGYKNLKIDMSGFGKKNTTLGKLWEEYVNTHKENNAQIEEIFKAVVTRVPMDSMSGAHVLSFKGFTGIRGFGSLLHGRTMESLGGADLDGDKAFVFFGGRNSSGQGEGFKKEWKDMYDWSKNEYVNKEGFEEHNKDTINPLSGKTYREELTVQGDIKDDIGSNKALQYSPVIRGAASQAASEGRANLGAAVTQASYVKSAYSSIRAMDNSTLDKQIKLYGKDYVLQVKAISEEKNLRAFRGMTRASIGLSSDPMDEAGLNFGAYGSKLLNKQVDALFKYDIYEVKNGKRVYMSKARKNDILKKRPSLKSSALIGTMREINQAIYSKNWSENRRFDMGEIQEKLETLNNPANGLNESTMNTFIPKIGMDMKGLDWSDGVLKRVDHGKLNEVYTKHKDNVLNGVYDWINKALGRTSSAVPKSAHYEITNKYKLFTKEGMEAQLNSESNGYERDIFNSKGLESYKKFLDPDNMESRSRALKKLVKTAEDFVVNDLSDIASYNYINKLSENISVKRMAELAKRADDIKKSSHILANKSKKINNVAKNYSPYTANYLKKVGEYLYGDKTTSALNQSQIDKQIKEYKEGLSTEEAKLFDGLMLSTIWRGKEFDRQAMIKRLGKPPEEPGVIAEMETMLTDANKTSLSRVGYASEAVSNTSVKGMLKEYSDLFDYSIEKPIPKLAEKMVEASEKVEEPITLTDPDGNRIDNVKIIETVGFDKKTKKYFDELAPFIGLKEGKLSKEQKELSDKIKDHIKYYQIAGKDLNGVMRWLINKDINVASMSDFQTLNRWFEMTRDGTWWQKIMRPAIDKNATISKWHHNMFPKAIGEDLMRFELKYFDKIQPYKSKNGWVKGLVREPTNMMAKMQGAIHTMQEQSTQMFEEQKDKLDTDLRPYLEGITDGNELFRIAVRQREFKMRKSKQFKERYGDSPSLYNSKTKEYIEQWNKIQKEYNWEVAKDKVHDVTLGGGKIVKMTGQEIANNINKVITKWNKKVHGWMNGNRNYDLNKNEFDRQYAGFRKSFKNYRGDFAIVKKFIKKFDDSLMDGKKVELTEGIDGLREISKSQMISYFPEAKQDIKNNISKGLKIDVTGKIDYDAYWPHISGDKNLAAAGLKKQIEEFANDSSLSNERKNKEMTKAIYHYKQITGDFMPNSEINDPYEHASNILRDIATKKAKQSDSIGFFTSNPQVGSQHKRDAHIPGWSIEPEVYTQYMKGVIDNMYKHASQIKVRSDIHQFQRDHIKKTGDAKLAFEWVDFFNLYAQDALGYPQRIPERVLNNPNMKIKGTPLAWWNDGNVVKKINIMRSKLGIGKVKEADLPEELKGIDFGKLASWGNLEAKYQLATLLAHPKSAVANLYGGTIHTVISTGRENFMNARNIRYLQANVNPKWKNMTDVENWVTKLGVVEDFLMYEAGLNPKFKGKKWDSFFKEATGKLKGEPELSDKAMSTIAKKHGISDIIFNKAAWFMRRPERTLRRDAFMAHYLQAKNNFQGAITKYDDPMLIEIGKRGVKSTQFLYSAPFRPAFARSTMGKVMTRFQLWAWNSVRFRNQIIKEANLRGFREGTDEYERFKRLAATDMMMMGLSSIFMYSLFENALPAPWNWVQDLADWAFGNEKERSRAFFGTYPEAVAPLQLITPPSLRILPPLFKAMMNDDYSRLAGYYAWSMFPFGRIGHDLVGQGGLTTNPTRGIEKLTGLPYQQMGRYLKKNKDEKTIRVG